MASPYDESFWQDVGNWLFPKEDAKNATPLPQRCGAVLVVYSSGMLFGWLIGRYIVGGVVESWSFASKIVLHVMVIYFIFAIGYKFQEYSRVVDFLCAFFGGIALGVKSCSAEHKQEREQAETPSGNTGNS